MYKLNYNIKESTDSTKGEKLKWKNSKIIEIQCKTKIKNLNLNENYSIKETICYSMYMPQWISPL